MPQPLAPISDAGQAVGQAHLARRDRPLPGGTSREAAAARAESLAPVGAGLDSVQSGTMRVVCRPCRGGVAPCRRLEDGEVGRVVRRMLEVGQFEMAVMPGRSDHARHGGGEPRRRLAASTASGAHIVIAGSLHDGQDEGEGSLGSGPGAGVGRGRSGGRPGRRRISRGGRS